MGKDVLYVGDHIFGDIIKSKKQKAWRTMLVVPELNHELKVFHDKRDLFNTLESLDTSISELLRSFDMTSNEGPDAVTKIKYKIQVIPHRTDQCLSIDLSLAMYTRVGHELWSFRFIISNRFDLHFSTII